MIRMETKEHEKITLTVCYGVTDFMTINVSPYAHPNEIVEYVFQVDDSNTNYAVFHDGVQLNNSYCLHASGVNDGDYLYITDCPLYYTEYPSTHTHLDVYQRIAQEAYRLYDQQADRFEQNYGITAMAHDYYYGIYPMETPVSFATNMNYTNLEIQETPLPYPMFNMQTMYDYDNNGLLEEDEYTESNDTCSE